jgi:hypothetical protein
MSFSPFVSLWQSDVSGCIWRLDWATVTFSVHYNESLPSQNLCTRTHCAVITVVVRSSKGGFTHTMLFPCHDPATTVELCVVAARSRTLAGGQHAVSIRPMLLFDSHNTIQFSRCSHAVTLPRPCHEPAVKGIFVAWQGNSMVCVNQTRPHCVNQMGKTQSKPLPERHGRGMAWYVWIRLKTVTVCACHAAHNCTAFSAFFRVLRYVIGYLVLPCENLHVVIFFDWNASSFDSYLKLHLLPLNFYCLWISGAVFCAVGGVLCCTWKAWILRRMTR